MHIVPTDRITVPAVEPIQPVQDVVAKALDHRPELAQQRIQLENSKINLTGTRNAMLPTAERRRQCLESRRGRDLSTPLRISTR